MDTSSFSPSLRRALAIAEAKEQQSVEFLSELVQTPSLTGEEGPAQELVASRCEQHGALTERLDIDLAELFGKFPEAAQFPTHWEHDLILGYESRPTYEALRDSGFEDVLNYRGRPNVVATWKGSGGGRSIILNGHIDTVTIEPRADWSYDPFGAEIVDGCMYGRGTSDMKGGLMAGILAMKYLREAGVELAGDVILQSVVNEEHSGNGTLDLVRRGITADAAIVLEPTDNQVFLSHPGGLYWQLTVPGVQRSPGSRWESGRQVGVSAIEKLPAVITAMLDMEKSVNHRSVVANGKANDLAPMALVFGKAAGGYYETVTAAKAILRGSAYFPPGMGTVDDMINNFRTCIDDANTNDSFLSSHPSRIEILHHDDPTYQEGPVEVAHHMESLLQGHCHAATSREGTFACDMRHLVNRANVPSMVFGPGTISQAHKLDEHIKLADYLQSIKYLIACLGTWCNLDRRASE